MGIVVDVWRGVCQLWRGFAGCGGGFASCTGGFAGCGDVLLGAHIRKTVFQSASEAGCVMYELLTRGRGIKAPASSKDVSCVAAKDDVRKDAQIAALHTLPKCRTSVKVGQLTSRTFCLATLCCVWALCAVAAPWRSFPFHVMP